MAQTYNGHNGPCAGVVGRSGQQAYKGNVEGREALLGVLCEGDSKEKYGGIQPITLLFEITRAVVRKGNEKNQIPHRP